MDTKFTKAEPRTGQRFCVTLGRMSLNLVQQHSLTLKFNCYFVNLLNYYFMGWTGWGDGVHRYEDAIEIVAVYRNASWGSSYKGFSEVQA